MKDIINILQLKNIGNYLENENLNYLIRMENNDYRIDEIPILFKGYLLNLKEFLAYDYDLLSSKNKELYQLQYQKYKRNENGTYHLETKQYIKKNNRK